MPDGDGKYYQPGLGSFGPDHFDAQGQPLNRVIGQPANTSASARQAMTWLEWVAAYRSGGESALTILEGERQQARLAQRGVAYAFKQSDVCGGGKRLDECETGSSLLEAAQESASNTARPRVPSEGSIWNTPAWLNRTCGSCALNCEVAYETRDGEPTGITRLSNTRPLGDDIPVVRINL